MWLNHPILFPSSGKSLGNKAKVAVKLGKNLNKYPNTKDIIPIKKNNIKHTHKTKAQNKRSVINR